MLGLRRKKKYFNLISFNFCPKCGSDHPSIIWLFERVIRLKARYFIADSCANTSLPVVTWQQPTVMPTLMTIYLIYSWLCCANCVGCVYTCTVHWVTVQLSLKWIKQLQAWSFRHKNLLWTHWLTNTTFRASGFASNAGAKNNKI